MCRAVRRSSPIVLLLILASPACAGRGWRAAAREDTSAAWSAWVAAHPDAGRADLAARRAEERGWAEAQAADTSEGYGAYLGAFPAGPNAPEARARAEALDWQAARDTGTVEALTGYLARHPGGPHTVEAQERIEKAWADEARAAGTEESWGRYLVRYPQGAFSAEARQERDRLAWATATTAATPAAYTAYLARFPQGAHAAEAAAWLAAAKVTRIKPVVILTGTWQRDGMRSTVLARARRELERGLLAELKRDFTVLPVTTTDPRGATPGLPQEVYGIEPDTGLLVVEYRETVGRRFEPDGHANDVHAQVRLFVPPTAAPVLERSLQASTPEKIYGTDASVLETSAVKELGGQLLSVAPEVLAHRRESR